jgi:polar amino acid transport system substrate-binding protein
MVALLCALIMVMSVATLTGCKKKTKSALDVIMEKGKIIVGTSPDYPPYEYIDDATGAYVGFDIELMQEIADRMGVELEWKDMDFSLLLGALKAGQIDAIIACMSITEERMQECSFTDEYYVSLDAVLVKRGGGVTVTDIHDLAGLRVGVQSGTIQETWVREELIDTEQMPESKLSTYMRADDAVLDLVAGRIDCVFMDEGVAQQFTTTHAVDKALVYDLPGNPGIAVGLGETELVAKLNEIIAALQAEGFIDALAVKYQPWIEQ